MDSERIPQPMQLAGKILISMPGMADESFAHSVVFLCEHGPDSAMGLIINKPILELSFSDLLGRLDIDLHVPVGGVQVHLGGPVDRGRGFVLYRSDGPGAGGDVDVPGGYKLCGTQDILHKIANGQGPSHALLVLGYAGWGAGQLEAEILRNDWLISDISDELLFYTEDHAKWRFALQAMGVDPLMLSARAGRA